MQKPCGYEALEIKELSQRLDGVLWPTRFSSSAPVYGIPEQIPIAETAPLQPINPPRTLLLERGTAVLGFDNVKPYDGREGLRRLELLIGAYRSARDGRTVHLPLEY